MAGAGSCPTTQLTVDNESNGTHFAKNTIEYLRDTTTTSMKTNWASSSSHPGMSGRVLDDSSSDDYSAAPPSDMECGGGVCGDTAESRSSLLEFEKMSPQHLAAFEYAASNQLVPSVLADISIFPRYATVPTSGYVRCADLSKPGGKFNLRPLTDVTRGTRCSNVHQCDTIRDTAHEYDTLRGEKCHHKLLGAEERVVPSVEVNSRPSPFRNDDDGCRLVPQGRTHIDDSITTLQSLEADRYVSMTLSGDINESLTLSGINEALTLYGKNESLTLSPRYESLKLSANNETLTLCNINDSLPLSGIKNSLALSGIESLTLNGNESLTFIGLNELPVQTFRFNKTSVLLSGMSEYRTLSDLRKSVVSCGDYESLVLNSFNNSPTLGGIHESLRGYFTRRLSPDQTVPILQHRSNMVDVAVQTDPIEAPSIDIENKRLNHIDLSRKRRVEDESFEQVPTSTGPDDTCQLVETAVRMIAPDGFPRAASGGGEGIDLSSPVFKWNDGKRPRSIAAAATQASLASNKRTRLRLGLSRRARPPPLHRTVPNGL